MHYEALQQLARDRTERLKRDAQAERLACQGRGRRRDRRQRIALRGAQELLLGLRRQTARQRLDA